MWLAGHVCGLLGHSVGHLRLAILGHLPLLVVNHLNISGLGACIGSDSCILHLGVAHELWLSYRHLLELSLGAGSRKILLLLSLLRILRLGIGNQHDWLLHLLWMLGRIAGSLRSILSVTLLSLEHLA